eukprot:6201753-Pleurochrysis_carterae.AAC.1
MRISSTVRNEDAAQALAALLRLRRSRRCVRLQKATATTCSRLALTERFHSTLSLYVFTARFRST